MADSFAGDNRAADFVLVPEIAGLPFLVAQETAFAAGLVLANPDPDGPPIGAIVWPNNPTIQRQHPLPGAVMYRWDSLRVWLRADLEPDVARKLTARPPSVDRARATPTGPVEIVQITSSTDESDR